MVAILLSLDGGETIAPSNITFADMDEISPCTHSTSPGAIILVAASFWALIISVPGLAWHIKNRSLPAASMVGWIVLLNLMNIINALIWPNDNVQSWWDGEIYCDTEIKLEIAATIGLVGSLACIMRSLAQALDTTNIRLMPSTGQRARQLVLELTLCVGLPILIALLHFILQPLRYYVFAIAGCKASYSSSWYTVLLGYMWPPVLCMLNAYYAILLSLRIYRYRRDFSGILSNSSTGMNKSRFLRLYISGLTVLLVVIPTQAYALYVNTINGMNDDWSPPTWQTVVYVPSYGIVFPDRWIRLGIAIPVFLCFGWGRDARSIYRSWLRLLGLTKLFPCLGEPDTASTSPSRIKRSGNGSSSEGSTVFRQAWSFFSSEKDSSNSSSVLSSITPGRKSSLKLHQPNDVESQHSAVELTIKKCHEPTSISVSSVKVFSTIEKDSEINPISTGRQSNSWKTIPSNAHPGDKYERFVVGHLT